MLSEIAQHKGWIAVAICLLGILLLQYYLLIRLGRFLSMQHYLITRAYEDLTVNGRMHPMVGICAVSIAHLPEVQRDRLQESLEVLDYFNLVTKYDTEPFYRLDKKAIEKIWERGRPQLNT